MKKQKFKKITSIILMLIMLLSALPINAFASSDVNLGDVPNKNNINISVTKKYGHELHTANVNGNDYPLFCMEYGKKSPSSSSLGSQGVPTDANTLEAARWIFAGYYWLHSNDIDWLDMAYCQKKVWSIMGSESSWDFSDEGYNTWVANAYRNIQSLNTLPSFDNKNNFKIVAGKSSTISDTNNVFKYYPAFDYTENNIRYLHNAGSNDLIVSVDKNCKTYTFAIYEGKFHKSITGQDQNCLIYNPSAGGTQKLLYSAYYDPITFSVAGTVVPLGNISISKKDIYDASLTGAEFGLYSDSGCNNLITTSTSKNGVVDFNYLEPGKYYVREVKAPNGYLLNNKILTLNVTSNNTASSAVTNAEPLGEITVTKELDVSKTNNRYGDVKIDEAEYTLYAAEKITSKAGTKVFYNKDDIVSTKKVVVQNGTTATITWDKLPLGSYYIKETTEPNGAFLDTAKHIITLGYKNQNTSVIIDNSTTSTDVVKSQKVKLFKAGTDGSAGEMKGVANAQFTIKLYNDYSKAIQEGYKLEEIWASSDANGNWKGIDVNGKTVSVDKARATEAQKISPSYAVITSNTDGYAVSGYLPFGKYICKETYTPNDYISGSDVIFSIDKDESEYAIENVVKNININNALFESPIKIIKKDADSGKVVTLSSASYKIRATQDIINRATGKVIYHKGDYIQVKVGNNKYNVFMTNSDSLTSMQEGNVYASKNDEKGSVTTPFKLPAGYYELVELKSPDGFVLNTNTVQFVVTNTVDLDKDADGDVVCVVTQSNKQPKANIEINKSFNLRENMDKSLIDISEDGTINNIDKVTFNLIAADTITDKSDGSVVYNKGDVIETKSLTSDSKVEFNNLWMGSYIIKETSTIDGAVLDVNEYPFVFEAKDDTTEKYNQSLDLVNYTTEVDISKVDLTTGEELEGAELTLTDKDGNVIDSWVSTKENHKIEGLKVGETYILIEKSAPYGYEMTENIEFTINNDKEIQKVVMKDAPILSSIRVNKVDSITKQNIKSNKFSFTLYSDAECKNKIITVDANTEDGTAIFKDLRFGTYYIKETSAPLGYELSDEVVEIVINGDGVFANGKKIEELDGVYSIEYQNSLLPIVYTGDTNRVGMYLTMVAFLIIGIVILILLDKLKKRK